MVRDGTGSFAAGLHGDAGAGGACGRLHQKGDEITREAGAEYLFSQPAGAADRVAAHGLPGMHPRNAAEGKGNRARLGAWPGNGAGLLHQRRFYRLPKRADDSWEHGGAGPEYRLWVGSFLWLAAKLEDFTLPRADGVFCNSAYTENQVRPRNPRTWRVPNPLRSAFFAPLPERQPAKRPRLINVGVISPRKRQLELLAMFTRLKARGLDFQVEFVGEIDASQSYGRQFVEAIRAASDEGYAVYSEYKQVAALIEMLDQADGCIHFPTEEAFGLIVAEALARNLKFFGSRVGGIVDITASVEGAELFGADDWTGLEQALVRWFEDGAPHPQKAAQVMAQRYHPRAIAERHLDIYREVLSTPRGRK